MADSPRSVDPALAGAAVYANSYRTLRPLIGSTGLRTHPLRYEAARHADGRVAEEFLVNSRLLRRDVEFELSVGTHFTDSAQAMLSLAGAEGKRGFRTVPLPRSVELRLAFGETVRRRRSRRVYTGDAMPLAYLATIARAACGITGQTAGDGQATLSLRSTASGGGLYPIDLHFAALRVDGLPRGTYLYDPRRDALWQTGDEADLDAVMAAFAAPDQVISTSQATAVCLLTGRPWRTMRKYGARGMRHLFLEAGAMAAHINLAATALGFGSVDCSSIYDDEAHEALRMDGLYEALVHSVVLGAVA
jgi:SagB-type dehydrogenase family enzyme